MQHRRARAEWRAQERHRVCRRVGARTRADEPRRRVVRDVLTVGAADRAAIDQHELERVRREPAKLVDAAPRDHCVRGVGAVGRDRVEPDVAAAAGARVEVDPERADARERRAVEGDGIGIGVGLTAAAAERDVAVVADLDGRPRAAIEREAEAEGLGRRDGLVTECEVGAVVGDPARQLGLRRARGEHDCEEDGSGHVQAGYTLPSCEGGTREWHAGVACGRRTAKVQRGSARWRAGARAAEA